MKRYQLILNLKCFSHFPFLLELCQLTYKHIILHCQALLESELPHRREPEFWIFIQMIVVLSFYETIGIFTQYSLYYFAGYFRLYLEMFRPVSLFFSQVSFRDVLGKPPMMLWIKPAQATCKSSAFSLLTSAHFLYSV